MSETPEVRPESSGTKSIDSKAESESFALQKQELDEVSHRKEHHRQERLRDILAHCVNGVLVVVFIIIAISILIVAWHYRSPEKSRWLSGDDIKTVSTVLFSGTLFAIIGQYVRDRL